eukprot:CAMPEP_0118867746 /NCGR_PEP_ID=MMETSP1163-20130328/11234_1 /TAXON_ID=124430 /ORGANISM="Phaeomonas parva, Strain CCMP2877" /LENGTH=259 /DNA_ID=CAMNT_0006802189 /DNA_START=93 /DNA_END=872 /DNA_ORIENTATION=+
MSAPAMLVVAADEARSDAALAEAHGLGGAVVVRLPPRGKADGNEPIAWPQADGHFAQILFQAPYGDEHLSVIFKLLAPRGVVELSVADINAAKLAMLMAGFENAEELREEKAEAAGIRVRARKPDWNVGAASSVKINKPVAATDAKSLGVVTWSADDNDEDLIDDDELLDESTLPPAPAEASEGGCGSRGSGRRPCKDCSCGRADGKEAVTLDPAEAESACGNCHKGDAFRCAACPYLGKPAFEKGEGNTITLNLSDDI